MSTQAKLIAMLLPPILTILVSCFEELKTLGEKAPKSLLFTAATTVIREQLVDPEIKRRAFEVCGTARSLLANLPFLKDCKEFALDILASVDADIECIMVQMNKGGLFNVFHGLYEPLLSVVQLDSDQDAISWAHKFLKTAVEKGLDDIQVSFRDCTDEEWKLIEETFLEVADKMIADTMEGTGTTYVRTPHDLSRSIYFLKRSLKEADLFYWKSLGPCEW